MISQEELENLIENLPRWIERYDSYILNYDEKGDGLSYNAGLVEGAKQAYEDILSILTKK